MDTQIQKATQYIIPQYDILDKEKKYRRKDVHLPFTLSHPARSCQRHGL